MNPAAQIAKQLRAVFFGGNWTDSNLKDNLADVTWQEAITQVHGFNTIATLTYHVNYYISGVKQVLEGGTLDIKDKFSFAHPPINSQADWEVLLTNAWAEAEAFASLIEQLPEEQLWADFTDEKYGSYYKNLHGIIEHLHYHLGQIVLIKRLVRAKA